MARGSLEAGEALIKVAVNTDVSKFPPLEAGFMVSGMVMDKRYIVVTAGPPDLDVSNGDFFFFG